MFIYERAVILSSSYHTSPIALFLKSEFKVIAENILQKAGPEADTWDVVLSQKEKCLTKIVSSLKWDSQN